MKVFIYVIIFLGIISGCSKKLDNVTLNDNPYDEAYSGPIVINMSSIITDTVSFPIMRNYINFTKSTENYDGVRLYRGGVLINTNATSSLSLSSVTDNSAISGVTYTYQLRLYLGSGETESDFFTFTTP